MIKKLMDYYMDMKMMFTKFAIAKGNSHDIC